MRRKPTPDIYDHLRAALADAHTRTLVALAKEVSYDVFMAAASKSNPRALMQHGRPPAIQALEHLARVELGNRKSRAKR